ncbi:hypothetical protein AB3M83_07745 [Microbacterium sp. 179-B 1A2 NHS]|uniref:hypothetical protein n=1 Tax=Microbacterium sp. 179-B 1A2 NHS TaxID=3142383 RepID=UPI0039A3575E
MVTLSFRRRVASIALILSASLAFSACTAETPAAPGVSATVAPSTSAAPDPVDTIDPADVTCENMLGEATVDEFETSDWSVREDPFVILDLELPDGIACTWGDFSSPTSDDLVLFGWSPISADDASGIQDALIAESWIREKDGDGVLITEAPALALRLDAEGYGMTYRFGDGWVMVSDTKQGLDLIDLG